MDPERWQRVAHIYELTLLREPAERAAFLAEASVDDAEMRREVESLLAHDSTPLLIDRPMLELAAAVLTGDAELAPGTQLGPYRIDVLLGAGGMGQVYRAMDMRLNRTVAVKVLPKALATNPQFRARFDREAEAIAALTHPHICTLYDIGHQNGVDFLVMEYLEGETLAARLEKGPLPLDQALKYSVEISDALAATHRRGIIHRDLKPRNIILTKGGAKLLDFGLAKPVVRTVLGAGASTPASVGATAQGTILGTFQYMAPEQLEGKEADARTDIFALGAVIYEMLTGKKAFEGKSQAVLIGAIMHAEPPAIAKLRPLAPPGLDRIVRTCLAKDPDERWQDARDLCRELQWVGHDPAATPVIATKKGERLAWTLTILLAMGVVAVAIRPLRNPDTNPRVARFTVAAPPGTSIPSSGSGPEISPDGTQVVFPVRRGGEVLLAVRPIDTLEAHVLEGTQGASFPFWSPDSRVIAFFANGQLKKMNVSLGGPIQIVCNACPGLGGTWNQQDVIVFSARDGLHKVSATGREPSRVLTASPEGARLRYRPQFLPDGRRFLYFVQPDAVYLASLDGGEPKRILSNTSSIALYAPPGYLVFRQESTIVAQRFDADLTNPLGDPIPIAEDVRSAALPEAAGPIGGAAFSISEDGVLAYVMSPETNVRLEWFDRNGRPLTTIEPLPFKSFGSVELSPDGTQVAMQSPRGPSPNAEIWLVDLAQRQPAQLTFTAGSDRRPVWSPDGGRLVFASRRREAPGLYVKSVGGEQPEKLVLPSHSTAWDQYWPTDWSPKGILLESGMNFESVDIWMFPIDGDRKLYPVIQKPGNQGGAKLSPDGGWVAYTERLERPDVYVESLSTHLKHRISPAGGSHPVWRRDGTELFYLAADGQLMAVPIERDASGLRIGAHQPLFPTRLPAGGESGGKFNVSRDGQKFLIPTADDQSSPTSIVVVINWAAAMQQ